ncbi:aminotransferase class III-fold pyridoxal phosphate-dependent enzyme [Patescibacteria group bacterium]|nr:MAG: aminotransferase class III-fold pyridoxal phosphate-dependent enzyme [Patescibacteria group bacterium]
MSDHLLPSYESCNADTPVFVRGHGSEIETTQRSFLDFLCGAYCSAMLGHGDRDVRKAMMRGFSADLIGGLHQPALDLAAELCSRTGYARVSYGTSGSEAADAAIRMVYQCQRTAGYGKDGKSIFVTLKNGFHGTTLATLTTSGFRRRAETLPAPVETRILGPWVTDPAIGSTEQAREALAAEAVEREGLWPHVGGFLFEPIQGVAGIRSVNPHCYRVIAERCREHGVLIVADEITTGVGRTGRFLASETFEPRPDIVLLGKALTNGEFPLSAVLITEEVWRKLDGMSDDPSEKYLFGSTFAGHPTGCLAALAVLKKLDAKKMAWITTLGEMTGALLGRLRQYQAVRAIRGVGLMWGIELRDAHESAAVVAELLRSGIRCSAEGKVLVIFPNLRMNTELLQLVERLQEILAVR